jgi:xylulokinase
LADIQKKEWSQELCSRLGIPFEKLPRIVNYHAVVGKLSQAAAKAVSLPSGIPLVAGAGDKIAGCIGAGILTPGNVTFEASSYAAVSVLTNSYHPNLNRRDYDAIPALEDNQFYLHRYFPGSGITLQWFIDTFSGKEKSSNRIFKEIETLTERVPAGSDGLMAVGMLGGSAMPFDGTLRGCWVGHTWSHRKEHFYRALLESFAYELALTLDSIKTMYPYWDRQTDIILTGGGSGSAVWAQILADAVGCNVIKTDGNDAALWGSALLAAKAIGAVSDIRTVTQTVRSDAEKITANTKNTEIYQKNIARYSELLDDIRSFCSKS